MFMNNLNPLPKSPSNIYIFKPNATMISMTADDVTMNVYLISWNHDFSFSKPILEAFKIINILKII